MVTKPTVRELIELLSRSCDWDALIELEKTEKGKQITIIQERRDKKPIVKIVQ